MTTDADRWVAERLAEVQEHPAWPGGHIVAEEVPARAVGKRYTGWLLRAVGAPIPAADAAVLTDPARDWPALWWRLDGRDMAIVQVWALRADAPGSPAWVELRWWPGLATPEVAFRNWMRLAPEDALALFKAGYQLVVARLPAGRHALEDDPDPEALWRVTADKAEAIKLAEPHLTWPQIAGTRLQIDESLLEKYRRRRKRELGRQHPGRNNGGNS